ncbi:alpha/beta hydrolase [Rubritalea sp.]|uniref:alpha/beta hydrolase n=1 Tax=Rubritalea sp. TaxID=2109375 RepID=UPI003EF22F9E
MIVRNRQGEAIDYTLHDADRDDVLVIFGHGVTANKDRPLSVGVAERLAAKGWPTMRISFAGNGDSGGRFEDATILKEVDDLHSVLDQVKGPKQIVYVGHSMGGAVGALATAKDDRINVLVSLAGMVRTKAFYEAEFGDVTPDEGFMWEDENCPLSSQYAESMHLIDNTLIAARDIRAPWLILHGDADDLVLPKDSEDLFLTLRGKKKHVVIEGAYHVFAEHYDQLADEIDGWLKTHVKG